MGERTVQTIETVHLLDFLERTVGTFGRPGKVISVQLAQQLGRT